MLSDGTEVVGTVYQDGKGGTKVVYEGGKIAAEDLYAATQEVAPELYAAGKLIISDGVNVLTIISRDIWYNETTQTIVMKGKEAFKVSGDFVKKYGSRTGGAISAMMIYGDLAIESGIDFANPLIPKPEIPLHITSALNALPSDSLAAMLVRKKVSLIETRNTILRNELHKARLEKGGGDTLLSDDDNPDAWKELKEASSDAYTDIQENGFSTETVINIVAAG